MERVAANRRACPSRTQPRGKGGSGGRAGSLSTVIPLDAGMSVGWVNGCIGYHLGLLLLLVQCTPVVRVWPR